MPPFSSDMMQNVKIMLLHDVRQCIRVGSWLSPASQTGIPVVAVQNMHPHEVLSENMLLPDARQCIRAGSWWILQAQAGIPNIAAQTSTPMPPVSLPVLC
jgi:hypothetical protein